MPRNGRSGVVRRVTVPFPAKMCRGNGPNRSTVPGASMSAKGIRHRSSRAVEFSFTGVATGNRLAGWFRYLAAQLVSARENYPGKGYASFGLLPQLRRAPLVEHGEDVELPPNLCIGDPHRITRMLKQWEETGVDVVNFLLNAQETVDQAQVLESLRLFGREVMPHFAEAADRKPRFAAS